ncbi:gamma-aminobutyric acid type B receptor subunit 2-like isoform X2 [Dysidea avara]|uniref:gamma-aminobutyric acid type B receptor subunit 2-like isoform X2 n=1 Tax=Dysidea avara TaxID=196820 RepID=UPI00331BA2E9
MTVNIRCVVLVLVCLSTASVLNGIKTLHLGAYIGQEGVTDFTGLLVALDIAIETIKNNASLQYNLTYTHSDSMCRPAPTLRSFIDQIYNSSEGSADNQIMLLGPDCSVATEPVAEIAPNWNLVQAATRFRTVLSEAKLQIIKELTLNTAKDVTSIVMAIRDSPARIVFVNMYSVNATQLICRACEYGLVYPSYQWMFPDWYVERWWNATTTNCSVSQLEKFLEHSLTFGHYPRLAEEDEEIKNVGNITWREYEDYYKNNSMLLARTSDNLRDIRDSAFMFDAAWTAALAINRTASRLSSSGIALENFTYDGQHSRNISRTLYEEALKVSFFGLTGDVSYDENGDRPASPTLLQYRRNETTSDLSKVLYARVINDGFEFEEGESIITVFPDGAVVDEEQVHISLAWFIVYTILSFLGICFAMVCLIFNLWFRNQKVVKLTSPYVNVMIIAGAVIFYITVILFGVDENVASSSTVDHLCQTRVWLVAIGFSLLFGSIFAKTWRIYYIFYLARPNSKFAVKDMHLFGVVAVLVLIDTIIMIPSTVISSAVLRREEEEIEGDNDNDLPQVIGVCSSDGSAVWLPLLFGYKGFFLLAGLILAIGTRKVKYSALNESQFIAMSVYGAVVVSIALTPIGFLLENFPTLQYAILGMMILLSITLILALVFVSKMYKVYDDPKGKNSLCNSSSIGNKQHKTSVAYSDDDYKRKIESLNSEIKVLNGELVMLKSSQQLSSSCTMKGMDGFEDIPNVSNVLSKDKEL